MRVLWQPTTASPADWETIDSQDWGALASVDFHGLCVQGRTYDGADHYAVRNLPSGGIKVFLWYDDPDDWPPGQRWARVTTVPFLKPDAALGGAINTCDTDVVYAEAGIKSVLAAAYRGNPRVRVADWADFTPPQAKTQHGIWTPDAQHEDLLAARRIAGWREWTEGLDPRELDDNGLVKDQRRLRRFIVPDGTRTYYHSDQAGPDPVGAEHPNSLTLNPTGAASESATINQNGQDAFSAVSPVNEPDTEPWPTIGDYRYQLDVTAVGADLTFGLLVQGNGTGQFARVSASGTVILSQFTQDQAAFSSSGLHLASVTDPAWPVGDVTFRFAVVVAGFRPIGHGNQLLTLQLGELDDFADGPWPADVVEMGNAAMVGASF
jgi:hypothetical protein